MEDLRPLEPCYRVSLGKTCGFFRLCRKFGPPRQHRKQSDPRYLASGDSVLSVPQGRNAQGQPMPTGDDHQFAPVNSGSAPATDAPPPSK